MRSGQPESSKWHLAESVAERVFAIYAEAFGSMEPLFEHVAQRPDSLRPLSNLPMADLARMTKSAITYLAGRDALMAGREGLRRCDWRVVIYSLTSARTLREAIIRCCDSFEAIDWRCGKMVLRTHGETAQLELEAVRTGGSTLAGCLIDLFGVMEIHGLLGWLIDHPIAVRNAWLNHSPEVFATLDLPDLPFPVRLAQGWSGFDFNASFLDYPVMRSWEDQQRRPLSNLLFASSTDDTDRIPVETRVRGIAMTALRSEGRLPAFAELVSVLGGSEATLRRQLAREGTSYRQVRESCRRELALDLLRRTDMSIENIAGRLDYCDSDAFRQAFRTWTGHSPTAYRDSRGMEARRQEFDG